MGTLVSVSALFLFTTLIKHDKIEYMINFNCMIVGKTTATMKRGGIERMCRTRNTLTIKAKQKPNYLIKGV